MQQGRMAKKKRFGPVPPVDPQHIISAYKKVIEDREKYGSIDIAVSVASLFAKKLEPGRTLDIMHRICALGLFIAAGHGKEWIQEETGKDYVLMHESLFRAAARAPLMEAEYTKDICFDKDTFLPIELEETKTEGAA